MNNVNDFMSQLKASAPMSKENFEEKSRTIEKIYLNYPGNYGRYQVLPLDNVVTDFPFVTLFNTREIQIPRKNIKSDGTESVYNAWIRLLPKSAYIMKDASTGRLVSSLTASDDQLLSQAYSLFDQLYDEVDVRNNRGVEEIVNLARKRNYTIFHAMCLNKWDADSRTPSKQNFTGLFVCTAKGFINTIEDDIQEKALMNNGETSWLPCIYNRLLTDRDGFLMFSISMNKNGVGYSVTANHEIGRKDYLKGFSIPNEDAELMKDPVASFLGWQAKREDENVPAEQRKLFNADLIKEAISFMSQQLAAVRMAKNTGMSIGDAIKNTNAMALNNQAATDTMGQSTNDPMLASMASNSGNGNPQTVNNPERLTANNDSPFQTPPAAHIDPVTGAPVNNGNNTTPQNPGFGFGQSQQQQYQSNVGNTFKQPDFAKDFSGNNGDLPF